MLASELALEMGVDPSVISKRLGIYFEETGSQRERHLSAQTVDVMGRAHQLLESGRARNFKQSLQMVLGTYAEPLPPESVRVLERRLEHLESVQTATLDKVTRILQHLEAAAPHTIREGHDMF